MLENVLFLINIPKIAMSAKRSVFRLILFCRNFLYYSAIFVGGGARFGFVPRRRLPSLFNSKTLAAWLEDRKGYFAVSWSR